MLLIYIQGVGLCYVYWFVLFNYNLFILFILTIIFWIRNKKQAVKIIMSILCFLVGEDAGDTEEFKKGK
jgi:hypothetical protein